MGIAKNFVSYKCEKHDYVGTPSRCSGCRSEARKASRAGIPDGRAKNVTANEHGRNCLGCGEIKSWDEFANDVHGFNGKTATCKPCRKIKHKAVYDNNPAVRRSGLKNRPDKLKRDYGLESWEQVVRILDSQHGRCANRACGKEISLDVMGVGGNRAVIDHNHKTGKFRALLCSPCNTKLGVLESDENLILGLIEYLDKHRTH